MKTARRFLSTKATIWLAVILATTVVPLVVTLMVAERQARLMTMAAGPFPTTVRNVNEDVAEITWDGGPAKGFVISKVLEMNPGDRVEIFWMKGCLQPLPGEGCWQPWGFLDVLAENERLFAHNQGAFAVHIIQGLGATAPGYWNKNPVHIVWPRGENRVLIQIVEFPVRIYFNTLIAPGVYWSPAMQQFIPVDGYSPPSGNMLFRIVNRH